MQFKKVFSFVGMSSLLSLLTWSLTLLYSKIFGSFDKFVDSSVKTGWPWVYKIEEGTSGIGGYKTEYYIRYFIADYLVWAAIGVFVT